jgi:site-specific DNA recombinase
MVQAAAQKSPRDLLPASVSRKQVRPIKTERKASLLKSIARGRQWLEEIVFGAVPRCGTDC